jgi:uncharacterized membrane protein
MSQSDDRAKSHVILHLFAAVGFLSAFALAAIIWRFGPPGQLAVHFDLHGRPNYWMDRTHAAIATAELVAGCALIYSVVGLLTGSGGRDVKVVRLVIVLLAIMIALIMTGAAFGTLTSPNLGPSRLQPAILSLLFLVVGALIGKASPNPVVGVRTYWTLRSRLAWDKSNRLAGRLFFLIGILGLAASAVAPPAQVVAAVVIAVIAAAVAAVVESWRVWRSDPERAAPRR